ncbi:MAG: hypothetical protein ABSF70_02430 [Terracidiphilus sp.]|jgi:hypothetical protein
MRLKIFASTFFVFLIAAVGTPTGVAQTYYGDENGNLIPAEQWQAQHSAQKAQRELVSSAYAQRQGATTAHSYLFVRWQDPTEGAFSASLPRGWQITGGTQRTTRFEPHYVIRAQSPDSGVQMFMDDPRIAIRQVPNGMMGREGQFIPSAWGGKLLVQRYRPAPQAAEEYVQKAVCSSATEFHGGIIPGQTEDLNNEFGPIARAEGKQIHVDVGELSFKCGDKVGYAYAITLQAWQQGGPVSLWLIYRIAGYLASPAQSAQAASAMHTMLGSFQMNQQWLENFARECNDTAGNVIRESNAVTQSTIARARQQDAESQSRFDSWKKNSDANFNAINRTSKAITGAGSYSGGGSSNGHDYNAQLGTKTVCDDLGRCAPVDASVTNYYSDCSGTFYPGSESGSSPSSSTSACWNKGH